MGVAIYGNAAIFWNGEKTNTQDMARRRALLTDRERELLNADEKSARYYQAVSRIRRKINEELPEDIDLLNKHHSDLHGELREVVCGEGRRIYCPICGSEFEIPALAVHHMIFGSKHDLSTEEVKEYIPEWWWDEQEDLSQFLGEESDDIGS